MSFVNLHVHTDISPDSTNQIEPLVAQAKALGQDYLAITNHGSVASFVNFEKTCKQYGISPIFGNEFYIDYGGHVGHLTVIAKNEIGYNNIIRLNNESDNHRIGRKAGGGKANCTTVQMIQDYSDGLIVLTGCAASPVYQNDFDFGYAFVEKLARAVGHDNIFAELTFALGHKLNLQNANTDRIIQIASEMGLPLVVTGDCHYTLKEDKEAHSLITKIRTGFSYPNDTLYLMSEEEMKNLTVASSYDYIWEQSLQSMDAITSRIEPLTTYNEPKLPDVTDDQRKELHNFLLDALDKYIMTGDSQEKIARFNYEMNILKQMDFVDYFYFIYRIAKFCKENSIPINCRGSAAGSLVLYLLGVSFVCPIKNGLQFERFLNVERKEYPDVDLDISSSRREEVFQFLYDNWGFRHVSNYATFQHRSLVNELAKNMDIDDYDLTAKASELGSDSEEFIELCAKYPEFEKVYNIALNQIRNKATHAAAVASVPEGMLLPIEDGAIALDKKSLEAVGAIKLDVLGLTTLTQLELMLADSGLELPSNFDDYPDEVFSMLSSGESTGLFQFSSAKGVELLSQVKPKTLLEMADVIALNRPAVLQQGYEKVYLANKYGDYASLSDHDRLMKDKIDKVCADNPEIANILAPANFICIYQEQMMSIYALVAGGGLANADVARRILSPKSAKERERPDWQAKFEQVKNKFFEAETKYSASERVVLWDAIKDATGYSFNKSHSVAYAAIGLMQAYIKTVAPLAYYVNLLRGDSGTLAHIIPYIYQMNKENKTIQVAVPHLNKSTLDYQIDKETNTIYLPLQLIKGLGEKKAEQLLAIRESGGEFTSIDDINERIPAGIFNKNTRPIVLESDCIKGIEGYVGFETAMQRIPTEISLIGFAIPTDDIVALIERNRLSDDVTAGYVIKDETKPSKGKKINLRRLHLFPNGFGYFYPNEYQDKDVKVGDIVKIVRNDFGKITQLKKVG